MNRIEEWAYAIKKHEGYFKGSASYRNNNPGNFRCSSLVMGELGAVKCSKNLAVFPDYETGWKALKQFLIYACTNKLRSYKSTMTLLQFYQRYAPSSDNNNPLNYATCVANDLNISVDTQIGTLYDEIETTNKMIMYSQNDPKWKNDKMGKSTLNLGNYGCTTSCISTLGTWFGEVITPKQLASTENLYTPQGLVIWRQIDNIFSKMKFMYRYYSFNEKIIDDYLVTNPNTVVLLNVNNRSHWVSALKKVQAGYLCSDPYPNPAKNRVYPASAINGFSVLIRK
jgi:hypothetical protein